MAAQLIDGEKIATDIRAELKAEVEVLAKKNTVPHLKAVQVGENPASRIYVKNQEKSCEEIGIAYTLDELPEDTTEEQLIDHINKLNTDKETTGIILQMPLPKGINAQRVQSLITPTKDVEGMNLASMGAVVYGNARLAPCTAMAAIELTKSVGIDLTGMEATIVGRSAIVGKPVSLMLLDLHVTPTVCHTRTKDLAFHTKKADILVAAVGRPETISGNMIKPGAIVIDVGINRVPALDEHGNQVLNLKGKPKKKTVGDVVFDEAKDIAGYITPVPGGVGPMTVVMLLKNTVEAAKMFIGG
jgi:methylenetetrahydrofolate dehydrogenase (NADP+)/methenyltetrahydrofolate cyclohydrolase